MFNEKFVWSARCVFFVFIAHHEFFRSVAACTVFAPPDKMLSGILSSRLKMDFKIFLNKGWIVNARVLSLNDKAKRKKKEKKNKMERDEFQRRNVKRCKQNRWPRTNRCSARNNCIICICTASQWHTMSISSLFISEHIFTNFFQVLLAKQATACRFHSVFQCVRVEKITLKTFFFFLSQTHSVSLM